MLFDSEYYAENNADVTAVYGTDKNALARHYVTVGVNEGRLPYAPGTDVNAYQPVQEKKVLKKTETYDQDGRLTRESLYDAQGNLIRKSSSDGRESEEYAYDSAGNQISEVRRGPNYFRETMWRYDSYGNMTFWGGRSSEEKEITGRRYEYEYDSQGRKTKKTEYDGDSDKVWTETEYSYETRGNMNIVTEAQFRYKFISGTRYRCFDGLEEYVYDNNGNEIKHASLMKSGNLAKLEVDKSVLQQGRYNEHVYDSQGNLIRSTSYMVPVFSVANAQTGKVQDVICSTMYAYDLDTHMLVPTSSAEDCLQILMSTEYSYDSWGNLKREEATHSILGDMAGFAQLTEYDYDSQGNRTMETSYNSNGEKISYTVYIYE